MRKLASAVLAVAMTLAMTVTAFAAPSPTTDVKPVSGTVTTDSGEVTLDSDNISDYVTVGENEEDTTAATPEGYTALTSFNVNLLNGVKSATITLSVPGVKAGQTVVVKQYVNGEWIDVEATVVADGEIEVALENSGAVAVSVKAEATATDEPSSSNGTSSNGTTSTKGTTSTTSTTSSTGTSSTTSSTTSPKTGEANVAAILVLAAAFAGVAAVAGKKANA